MEAKLKELQSIQDLAQALDESSERPVLLFKHSLTCSISMRAFAELQQHLERAGPRATYKLITVQSARAVSNEVAARLQLMHQSPQAILLRNGRDVWNASHSAITAAALDRAIQNVE